MAIGIVEHCSRSSLTADFMVILYFIGFHIVHYILSIPSILYILYIELMSGTTEIDAGRCGVR